MCQRAPPVELTVALDATLWDEPTTGIARYARAVSGALEALGVRVLRVGARRSGELPRRVRSRTLHTLTELPRVLPRSGASVFHAVANVDLPLLRVPGVPFVLTVHDLIPLSSPDTVSRAFHWQFRLWLARSLRVADHVVCVSAWTRDQLLQRHPELEPARVSVVHNGVDHVQPAALDTVSRAWLRSLGLPERWVLFAGALDARKNVELVLQSLERLGPAAPTLVLAGQRWYGAGPIERRVGTLRAAGFDIRPLGFLAEPMLWALMAASPVFVFPSRDEGFGLPPLEAMALGTPVVVSTAAALPEVCGDAAVQVHPDDAAGLATALQRLLDDPAERSRRGEAGRARARGFRWRAVAEHLVEVYRRVAHTSGRSR
jgi:glycosyltransferase involved in cell wall biosynthesis